jgi:CheY-like chemotaxis protein
MQKPEEVALKHILVIDDDIHIGDMLEEVLVREGYAVSRAYSGTEAVLVLSKAKSAQAKPAQAKSEEAFPSPSCSPSAWAGASAPHTTAADCAFAFGSLMRTVRGQKRDPAQREHKNKRSGEEISLPLFCVCLNLRFYDPIMRSHCDPIKKNKTHPTPSTVPG